MSGRDGRMNPKPNDKKRAQKDELDFTGNPPAERVLSFLEWNCADVELLFFEDLNGTLQTSDLRDMLTELFTLERLHEEATANNAQLRLLIESAPHEQYCAMWRARDHLGRGPLPCDCWKSEVP